MTNNKDRLLAEAMKMAQAIMNREEASFREALFSPEKHGISPAKGVCTIHWNSMVSIFQTGMKEIDALARITEGHTFCLATQFVDTWKTSIKMEKARIDFDSLIPLVGTCEGFHKEVRKLSRPYTSITLEQYRTLTNGDADYYRTPDNRVVTFGAADGGYALMPLLKEYADALLKFQPQKKLVLHPDSFVLDQLRQADVWLTHAGTGEHAAWFRIEGNFWQRVTVTGDAKPSVAFEMVEADEKTLTDSIVTEFGDAFHWKVERTNISGLGVSEEGILCPF